MAETYTFEHVNVKMELVQRLMEELPKFGFSKVRVLPADPATEAEIPCIGVNRIDDSESDQSIADYSGSAYDQDTQIYKTAHGTYFSESLEVRIWHTNADERDKLYHTTKAILFALRPKLVEKGLMRITLRSGKDEQDSSMERASVPLYWTTITMTYLNPLDVEYTSEVESITEIIDASRMNP